MVKLNKDCIPAIIFLVLYAIYLVILARLYATKQIAWKSRYTFVFVHVVLRIGGQVCGITFALMSWDNFTPRLNVLIAYLVLAAEGYFSLVLCTYRFLIVWDNDRLGNSILEPRVPRGTPWAQKMRKEWSWRVPMASVHWTLLIANTIIVTGGSILSNGLEEDMPDQSKLLTGKAMRAVGSAMFLALVQVFLVFGLRSYRQRGDRTLQLLLVTWLPLSIRGAYGIVSVLVNDYSYYNPDVYNGEGGMSSKFIIGEYVLGTTTEWIACGLLIATHFSSLVGGETMKEDSDAPRSPEAEMQLTGEASSV